MLPTGFRTFHFVLFLYVFLFSFLFLLFRFFSHYFVFVFLRFVFFSFLFVTFLLVFFSFFFFPFLFVSFRFFPFLSLQVPNKWQFNMEWGAKSRLYSLLLTPHFSFCRFLSFTPPKIPSPFFMYTSPKETLLRHWDKLKKNTVLL